MAKTKENPTSSSGENITPEALEVEEVISVEDEAEGNIYKKSPEEANADDDYLKDIQSTEAKEESDAETAASDQLGPEITGAKTDLKKRPSVQAQQPTNVLDRQEKAEEELGYAQPAITEIEEETIVAKELKGKKKGK